MRRRLWPVLALVVLAGCGRVAPPPVELGFRESLVGAGKIIRIVNSSNETLTGIEVKVEAPSGETRTFMQDELGGYQTFEIGWKKLGGWQVPAGSKVEIRAAGHLLAMRGRLPEAKADE